MIADPANPSDEAIFQENARLLAERERLSLVVNLPGIALLIAIAPLLSYGRFVLLAAALRLAAVTLTRWQGHLARRTVLRGAAMHRRVNAFAASLCFAAVTWSAPLWPVAKHGIAAEPIGVLLVAYVAVGVPLIMVMASGMYRLLWAFGGSLMVALAAIAAASPPGEGRILVLSLMGLSAAAIAGGFGMHRQQIETVRANLEKKALARALVEANEELETALAHAQFLSQRDPLTGLLNRRAFFEEACTDPAIAEGGGQVLAIDLDHFKSINDRFGHALGDRVLAAVADRMRDLLHGLPGEGHCAVRLGGEEFAIVLAGAGRQAAITAAEALRARIGGISRDFAVKGLFTSASIGVASLAPQEPVADALQRADAALYGAKQSGRDCVVPAAA